MTLINSRVCPICDSKSKKTIKHIKIVVPTDFILPSEYDIVVCEDCGFVFNDVENSNKFDEYYSNYKFNTNFSIPTDSNYDITKEKRESRHVTSVNFIEYSANIDKSTKILDIGCSYGATLSVLKERGYTNLSALDLDSTCVNYLNNIGIKSIVGSIFTDNLPEYENEFDLIILGHILEHLHEPKKAIKNIRKWLKPNGKIFIEVPDLYQYQKTGAFPGFFAEWEHINHFSIISLMNLLSDFRLKSYDTGTIYALIEKFPCLYAMFEKTEETRSLCITKTDENAMDISLNIPNQQGNKMFEIFNNLKNKEIAIWGAGQYLYRLLSHTPLIDCNIKFIVDKDINKQKDTLLDIKVSNPSDLINFDGPIVICSTTAKDYILNDIKEMGLKNLVIIPFN